MPAKLNAPYDKLRFQWKADVVASKGLSTGAKLLAVCLCDTFINRKTGICWPADSTLALRLGISIRTVERNLAELRKAGWLIKVRRTRTRRALKLHFPKADCQVNEPDKTVVHKPPEMSREPVRVDGCYKNQVYNKKSDKKHRSRMSMVLVNEDEEFALSEWRNWIYNNTRFEPEALMDLLRKRRVYRFPSRYPREECYAESLEFFEAVVSSDGRCLPG